MRSEIAEMKCAKIHLYVTMHNLRAVASIGLTVFVKMLKIWNLHRYTLVVAVFHTSKKLMLRKQE